MTLDPKLEFRFEWEPPVETIAAEELRATWARFQIWVANECVTLVEDPATGSARRSIYVSLYPLAEWIAFNWWLLAADGRPSWQAAVGPRSPRGHNFRAIGDGLPWPDLAVIPERDRTSLSWRAWTRADSTYPVRFISAGGAWLSSEAVLGALGELVDGVVDRLRELGVAGTALDEEWAALRALDREEAEFCRAAAQLGLDPFSEALDHADALDDVFLELEPALREEFLDAAAPAKLGAGVAWIATAMERAGSSAPGPAGFDVAELKTAFRAMRFGGAREEAGRTQPPWEVGYRDARHVRSVLGVAPTATLPMDPAIPTIDVPVDDPGIVGLSVQNEATPTSLVLGRPIQGSMRRFAVARALWGSLVLDGDRSLLTKSRSPEQQAGRAFAAELLAPASGIQDRLGGSTIIDTSDEAVIETAEHYGVSEFVVRHQIENQLMPN